MAVAWEILPMLPLQCVLSHLSPEDAVKAMGACSRWREHLHIYEGHRDLLKLQVNQLEKDLFLAKIFRKHTKCLHIYLDCNIEELDKFMTYVMPLFFHSGNLCEIFFIGPSFIKYNTNISSIKLKRILTETLILKHFPKLHKVAFFGSEIDSAINESDRNMNELSELYPQRLPYIIDPMSVGIALLNKSIMKFSILQHIHADYEQITTDALRTLSYLPKFTRLSLNIRSKNETRLVPIDWQSLQNFYPKTIELGVNIIELSDEKLDRVIDNVLMDEVNLVSLKVFYCRTLYAPLLAHVTAIHKSTIRELVWSDAPLESGQRYRLVLDMRTQYGTSNVNPFVLLCWQCPNLQRLVIHGYWIWQYDVLGFVRLRPNLKHLEISSIYGSDDPNEADIVIRVLVGDEPMISDPHFVQKVNEFTNFRWSPINWDDIPSGLKALPTPEERGEYIIRECTLSTT